MFQLLNKPPTGRGSKESEWTLTCCEGEGQGYGLSISERQQVLVGCEDGQLLEALTGAPDWEVVPSIVGLQGVTVKEKCH